MPNSDSEGRFFLSAPNNHDRFFFLHTFWSSAFDFNVGVPINESCSYMLTSAILKFDVVCVVAMKSTTNVLTTKLRDLLYNQCIGSTCWFSIFIHATGRIRVCKIRFVSTGENLWKPCLVCKKRIYIPTENLGFPYLVCKKILSVLWWSTGGFKGVNTIRSQHDNMALNRYQEY